MGLGPMAGHLDPRQQGTVADPRRAEQRTLADDKVVNVVHPVQVPGRHLSRHLPPVRFLGAMQTVLAMAVGAGVMMLGTRLWHFVEKKPAWTYVTRTALAAAAAALVVLIAVPGSKSLGERVRVFGQSDPKRYELEMISHKLSTLPQGRKLSGSGAENHWYNMLPYVWHRVPSTLQSSTSTISLRTGTAFTRSSSVSSVWRSL